jgi:uncharacterized membrane protein YheB (UPF0754 family)
MYLDKKERDYYEAQQKRYLDEISRIQEGIEKGIQEGIEKAVQEAVEKAVQEAVEKAVREAVEKATEQAELNKKIEIAKNAISQNLENELITKLTGLSIEQIESIRKDIK